jgi:GT2 family glycosyltransferase
VVAVEQSEAQEEARRVADAGVDRLLERPNLGYAAGLNAGVGVANGEVLLLANPDIRFFEGSLQLLLAGLDEGFDVVGPQFAWDTEREVLLPPAEDPAPLSEIGRSLRRRWKWFWTQSVSRNLEKTWRIWTADTTVPVDNLRGALLAIRAETMNRFGPLDEGYFLYYEETEWLWRARRRGARLGLAARALVQHRWGHSTVSTDRAAEIEQRSRERFI